MLNIKKGGAYAAAYGFKEADADKK
jgi:hypothetical protein